MEQATLKYPKTVGVDFRKLEKPALLNILKHYDVEPTKDQSQHDLAVMVARMFEATAALEDDVITKIADTYSFAETGGFTAGKKKKPHATRVLLDREPASIGEQVAAKANRADEDGSWILATVVEYDPRSNTYFVQDEDDPNRTIHLLYDDVRRLEDISSHLRRGDLVMAVFPETTSFYRAVVAKTPKPPIHHNAVWDVVVKFDDDEDETGKMPARRVPARFVIKRSDIGEDSEMEDN